MNQYPMCSCSCVVVALSSAFSVFWCLQPVISSFQSIFLLACDYFKHSGIFSIGQFLVSIYSAVASQSWGLSLALSLLLFPLYSDLLSVTVPAFFPCAWGLMAGFQDLPAWERSPSRGWPSFVKAPQYLSHPTSTLRHSC